MNISDRKLGLLIAVFMIAVGLLASACSSGVKVSGRTVPVPKERGIFLLTADEKLQRLDGNRDWEVSTWNQRSDLGPYLEFVVKHPVIGGARPHEDVIVLKKVAWVRSEISTTGSITPISGNTWAEPDLPAFSVPLRIQRLVGHGDVAHIQPTQPLPQGLYSFQIKDGPVTTATRIGVGWSSADRARYSSENCVDRYVGSSTSYRPCVEQSRTVQQIGLSGLQLHLVPPERTTINGESTLVIRGVIVNTSNRAQRAPALRARITDSNGSTLKHWLFEPEGQEIAPRQSLPFRTELRQPPGGTAKVNVNFASEVDSGDLRRNTRGTL